MSGTITKDTSTTIRHVTVNIDGREEQYTGWSHGLWMHELGGGSSHSVTPLPNESDEEGLLRHSIDPECDGRSSYVWVDSGDGRKVHAVYRLRADPMIGESVYGRQTACGGTVTGIRVSAKGLTNRCARCARW